MDEREFYILLKRGLTIMANDPSAGAVQRRGMRVMVEAIDRRITTLPPIEPKQSIDENNRTVDKSRTRVLQSN